MTIGVPAIQLGLERIVSLLNALGNPHETLQERKIPIVHVTGTNGKGSTVEMIANGICSDQESVVGVFTSPYMITERDSIRVFTAAKQTIIPSSDWSAIYDRISEVVTSSNFETPSDFELLFATALVFFSGQLDLTHLVIEVGMGGRLDATNVFSSTTVCVVTSIGMDHENFLGDTREKICEEKCGIFKRNCFAIVNGTIEDSCLDIISDKFSLVGGRRLVVVDTNDTHDLVPPLNGLHQKQLFGVAIEAVMLVLKKGDKKLVEESIRNKTKLPGRLERRKNDLVGSVILDGAHNQESAIALRQFVDVEKVLEKKDRIVWILAVSDGRSERVLSSLLKNEDVCICVNFNPEIKGKATWVKCVAATTELADEALKYCSTVYSIDGLVDEGLAFAASRFDKSNHLVVVAGSLYLVRNYLQITQQEELRNC